MAGMVHCQLWMGSLEPYMTETFILSSFRKMGENPLTVKVMRNKFTGEPAGYCFVHFATDEEAIDAMHKLNGKVISGTSPPVRFRLNNASNTGRNLLDREFSVWVGDLSPDVDDYNLYRVFSTTYNTIKTAKVILDNSGFSKGYGFVRFGSEEEMRDALMNMNGYLGLGSKALKICNAVPKPKGAGDGIGTTPTAASIFAAATGDYTQYCDPTTYWQNYTNWPTEYYNQVETVTADTHSTSTDLATQMLQNEKRNNDDLELIEHSVPVDVEKLNREVTELDYALWDALESAKWVLGEEDMQ